MKAPPTYKESPSTVRALTLPLAEGLNAPAAPVVLLSAAKRARAAPPIFEKAPPTKSVLPDNNKAFTEPSAFGFHAVATPLTPFTCAIRFLAIVPLTVVKSPPRYTDVPSVYTARTILLASTLNGKILPVSASTAAILFLV